MTRLLPDSNVDNSANLFIANFWFFRARSVNLVSVRKQGYLLALLLLAILLILLTDRYFAYEQNKQIKISKKNTISN